MQPAEAVLRFLDGVGRRQEADFYLHLFRALPKERFGIIAVEAEVARAALDAVTLHLGFLRALGLHPVVVLGLFEPAPARELRDRLQRRLEAEGVPCEAPALSDRARIAEACQRGALPLVALRTEDGDAVERRFAAVRQLLRALSARKLLFLHGSGGLRDGQTLLRSVNLTRERDWLLARPGLDSREREIVTLVDAWLAEQSESARPTVSLTSPLNLLRELFTVKGAGTMLRRGAQIDRHPNIGHLEVTELEQLLQRAFDRVPKAGIFARPFRALYLDRRLRGLALVEDAPLAPYLSKFAVERQARGEGLGRDLWERLAEEEPRLFWRARRENPISDWYTGQCDGMVRRGEWTVYWRGLAPEDLPAAIAWACDRPADFAD